MAARLPTPAGDNDTWGTILNDYLQQSLAADGTLLTTATNAYTTLSNTNLANSTRPGLVQLAGDLTTPYSAPKVVAIQGNAIASTAPTNGQVLTWNTAGTNWLPATPTASANARIITTISTATTAAAAANTDYVYMVTGGNTLTLPTAVGSTSMYTVVNAGGGITFVATTSSQTITFANGSTNTTAALSTVNNSLQLVSNGSNWVVTATNTLATTTNAGFVQLAGDITTPSTAPKVVAIQGKAISSTAPTDAQVLTWSASGSNWVPVTPAVTGGSPRSISSVSTATTAGAASNTDYVYLTSGTTTITLPTAVGNLNKYTVTNTGSNTVTVATTSSQTIDGSTTVTLPIANMSLDFISTGSNWVIL